MHILNINLERYSLILHGAVKIEGGSFLEAVIYQPNYTSNKLQVIIS
jgi:chloramphenicol O-acetyltransferase